MSWSWTHTTVVDRQERYWEPNSCSLQKEHAGFFCLFLTAESALIALREWLKRYGF